MEEVSATASENEPSVEAPFPSTKKRSRGKRILCALLVPATLLALIVTFFLGPIVKTLVNQIGASVLGVDKISVDSLTIYPFGGYVRVENFVIGKPAGIVGSDFTHELLRLDYFEFDFSVVTAFSQKKVIDSIVLKNLLFSYEQQLNGNTNIGALAAKFKSKETDESAEESGTKDESESKEPSEEIYLAARYVDIENINVRAYIAGVPSAPIPPISFEFKDGIGLEENLTPVQFGLRFAGNFVSLIRLFRGSVIGDFTGATVGAVSDAAGFTANVVSDAAKGTATVVTDVAGVTADVAGVGVHAVVDVAGATTEAVGETAKKIFDLFSSDKEDESENKK